MKKAPFNKGLFYWLLITESLQSERDFHRLVQCLKLPVNFVAPSDIHDVRLNVMASGVPEFQLFLDQDRKSTRLNSSHSQISYAVFCLKKKKRNKRVWLRNIIFNKVEMPIRSG